MHRVKLALPQAFPGKVGSARENGCHEPQPR